MSSTPPTIPARKGSLRYRDTDQVEAARRLATKSRDSLNPNTDPEWYTHHRELVTCEIDDLDREEAVLEERLRSGRITSAKWQEFQDDIVSARIAARKTMIEIAEAELNLSRKRTIPPDNGRRAQDEFVEHLLNKTDRAERRKAEQRIAEQQPTNADAARRAKVAEDISVELLLDRFDNAGNRSGSVQNDFRRRCIDEYQSLGPDETVWCPVLGDFFVRQLCLAAHIIPWSLKQKTMDIIFGPESADELFSVRNGLMLHAEVEECFDKHQIVFVPSTPVPQKGPIKEWRVRVIDQGILQATPRKPGPSWQELDGKLLQFRSSVRPAARYLYFHYVIALLRAQRHRHRGYREVRPKEVAWATPGRYMMRSMLQALIRHAGHDMPDEIRNLELQGIETGPPSPETDALAGVLLNEVEKEGDEAKDARLFRDLGDGGDRED